jgi:hypothetical protein
MHQEKLMKTKRKSGLEALYARVEAVRMSSADRESARASLAQADAVAQTILAAIGLARRLLAPRPGHAHTSA